MSLLLCGLVAHHAAAGELMLYDRADFGGRTLTLRATTPDLATMDFNDRAASLRVKSGIWELCTETRFRGRCRRFGPGEYPRLGEQAIAYSSVRQVAGEIPATRARRAPGPAAGESSIVFFDTEGFTGRAFGINAPLADFHGTGFDDRARSLVVRSGNWEVCTDTGYRGRCRVFTPGRYPALDLGLHEQISSARPVIRDARALAR